MKAHTTETAAQIKARTIETLNSRDDVSREELATLTQEHSDAHNREAAARTAARYPNAVEHDETSCFMCVDEARDVSKAQDKALLIDVSGYETVETVDGIAI